MTPDNADDLVPAELLREPRVTDDPPLPGEASTQALHEGIGAGDLNNLPEGRLTVTEAEPEGLRQNVANVRVLVQAGAYSLQDAAQYLRDCHPAYFETRDPAGYLSGF